MGAQSSGDRQKAIALLRECERLQSSAPSLPDPEAAHLCLAEVLLEAGRHAEAATAAVRATQLLRKQPVDDEERKVYGLLFALSLEQAALAAMGMTGFGPPPLRALRCLPDAEAAWALTKHSESEEGPTPGVDAARALLRDMRTVHGRVLQTAAAAHNAAHAAHSQSVPRLPFANAALAPAPEPKQQRPWTSPSKPAHPLDSTGRRIPGVTRQKQLQEEMKRLQNQLRASTDSLPCARQDHQEALSRRFNRASGRANSAVDQKRSRCATWGPESGMSKHSNRAGGRPRSGTTAPRMSGKCTGTALPPATPVKHAAET